MDVLSAEDERDLEDLEALDDIQDHISEKVKVVYDRRKLLRTQTIKKRVEDYKEVRQVFMHV